jgi:hypothetical protein
MRSGRSCLIVLLAAVAMLVPGSVSGQTAWDSPMLLPARPVDGLGIFLTDMHEGGIGVLGTWRSPVWNYGLRVGISEGSGGSDLAVFGGVDYMGPVNTATQDVPVDVDWVAGVGIGINDGARLSFPLGLTAAYSFQAESARFTPYLTPRIILDGFFGSENRPGRDGLGLGFAVDVGLDMRLTGVEGPFADTTIRFGASMGDRRAIGLGVVF